MNSTKLLTNQFPCMDTGCTFQARDQQGRRNHESRCEFSSKKVHSTRMTRTDVSVTRSALEDSDYEEVQGDVFNISYADDIEPYNTRQIEIKSTCKRTIPEIFNGEETGNDKDFSKCELVATLISEIAHKAGKEKTNQLLRLIGSNFNLTNFNSKFQDADACHRYVDEYVVNTLQEDGFMKQVIDEPVSGLEYSIFSRDPSLVIRRQVSAANPRNCFFSPVKVVRNGQKRYSHPLDTPAGRAGNVESRKFVKMRTFKVAYYVPTHERLMQGHWVQIKARMLL